MTHKKHFLLLTSWLLALSSFYSQDIKYAHKIIDTLTSPSMHGRGYVNDGNRIAATYIANEFKNLELKNWGQNYYQKFHLNINTFPGDWGLGFRGTDKYFPAGSVCLVNCRSGSAPLTKCDVIWLDSSIMYSSTKRSKVFFKKKFEDKALIIDPKGVSDPEKLKFLEAMKDNPLHARCIIYFNNKKLTWDASQTTDPFPSFELLVPDSINRSYHKEIKQVYFFIENNYLKDYTTQNVISYIKGSVQPDSFIVFSAHYDHLGQMGKDVYFPGANDNASGCAMLLNLAKYYSEHPPKYSIAFMAFGAEEAGLVGSKYYVEHPLFPLKQIRFLVNLDLLGTGDEGITVVNGSVFKTEFNILTSINEQKKYLTQIKVRGKAANSDHYFFTEAGVRSFFIYTLGGIKAYHDIYYRPETLPLTKFEDVFRLLTDFTAYLQK